MRAPFTVRLDPRLTATVRARAGDEGRSVAEVVADALRLYLASSTADEQRAALVSAVESELVERLDRRLVRAVEGLRDIAAKASFDQSLGLCLLQETLRVLFERDQAALKTIVDRARKKAAELLRRVGLADPDVAAAATRELERDMARLQGRLDDREQAIQSLQAQLKSLQAESRYYQSVAKWESGRVPWARQQFAAQPAGTLRRRTPLDAFLDQYEQVIPRPQRRGEP